MLLWMELSVIRLMVRAQYGRYADTRIDDRDWCS